MKLYEYRCGLLHAKTMLVDRTVGLIGSANLDRRSFELNFENNILFADQPSPAVIRAPAGRLPGRFGPGHNRDTSSSFGLAQRLWQNSVAMLSPIL